MEHNLEVPELFRGPYPNEKFEKNQLPQLENESLRFYKEQLKFWENDKALAFYFFEHRNLSAGVKAGIKTLYNKFKEKYKVFYIDNLKNYFTNLDITNNMAKSSLSLQWERIKRLATCSFGIQKNEFPKIKFSSCKQGREENISAINKDQYLKAVNLLNEKGQYEDALLIHIMWSLASRSTEMLTLRFEDFEDKNAQKTVLYYASIKNQKKRFTISEELYNQVMMFKKTKVNNGKYEVRSYTTPTGKLITGLKSRPKDIRMSSISNEFREHGIQKASSLGLHTSVKTTQQHYTRIAKDFK